MILNLKRYISLLLVLMLLLGIVPRAYAAEVPTEPVPEETVPETTIAESTEPDLDSTAPTEPTNPPGDAMLTGSDISTYSLDVAEGTCTSEGLIDGKLTTGEDGVLRFTGLHPHRLYRLTETKAPSGFQLNAEPVFSGSLQNGSTYFVQLTVTNSHTYELPMTGSVGSTVQTSLQIFGAVLLLGMLAYVAKKRRK